MSRKQRKLTIRQLGHLYERIYTDNTYKCWYCNDKRECIDHCPPLGLLPLINIDKFRAEDGQFLLIPSCTLCNTMLGNKHLLTPSERISWLLSAYKKLFNDCHSNWTEAEVSQMGYSLKVVINSAILKANSYADKICAIETNICALQNFAAPSIALQIKFKPPAKKVGIKLTVLQKNEAWQNNKKS